MRILYTTAISFLLSSLFAGAGLASEMEEYPLPEAYSNPVDVASDSEGRIWYAAQNAGKIGSFDPRTKGFKEYDAGRDSSPTGVAYDPANRLVWFTLSSAPYNSIGSISTETGAMKTYKAPTPNAEPYKIAAARDGSVWFTEANANRIGLFKDGAITEYEVPTKGSHPSGIAVDSKGVVWFTETSTNKLAKLDLGAGKITEYEIQHAHTSPAGVAVDSNDNVWVAETNGNRVSMFNPKTGEFNEAVIPAVSSVPVELAVAPDGRVWITANRGNAIYSLEPVSAIFEEHRIPTNRSLPVGITIDPNGDVWFVEADRDANRLARLSPRPIAREDEALPVAEAHEKAPSAARWVAAIFVVLLALGVWYIIAMRKRQ